MEPSTHSSEPDGHKDAPKATKSISRSLDEKHDSEEGMTSELISAGSEHLHRRLGGKEIQMLAVGGAIGTCKFVS